MSRTLVIWVVQLINKEEKFMFGELIAFIILILGTLIYNEIIIVPIECMQINTDSAINKRVKDTELNYELGTNSTFETGINNLSQDQIFSEQLISKNLVNDEDFELLNFVEKDKKE